MSYSNSNSDYSGDDEYVRPPDEVKRERLISDDIYWEAKRPNIRQEDLDFDLKNVLEKSIIDYNETASEKIEEVTRNNNIQEFMTKINNLATIDNISYEVKEVIKPYIDMYITYGITNMDKDWDDSTEKLVVSYLKTVRIHPMEKKCLKEILGVDF
jgi:hypothetical protein